MKTEQAVKLGDHAIMQAAELANRFDLSRKSIVESAINEYHAKYIGADVLTISRVAEKTTDAPPAPVAKPDAPRYKIAPKNRLGTKRSEPPPLNLKPGMDITI